LNEDAVRLFHELMKKGYIERSDNTTLFSLYDEAEVRDALDMMGRELSFEHFRIGDRIYLVPTEDNDLFNKNNVDYKREIVGGSDLRTRDLYLMNYLAIYILFLFFRGEGEDPRIRDFIMKDELISEFNKHCESIVKKDLSEGESKDDFSQNMYMLSEDWLGKKEGLSDSKKIDERYGILNKVLMKFRADDLFYDEGGKLTPSQKTIDLMPYMLRKERIISINNWLEETDNAENQ
jgi:hypothetical protein